MCNMVFPTRSLQKEELLIHNPVVALFVSQNDRQPAFKGDTGPFGVGGPPRAIRSDENPRLKGLDGLVLLKL